MRVIARFLAPGAVLLAGGLALAGPKDDPARDIAVEYLQALTGKGDDGARQHLLGGVPLAAQSYTIPNWNIIEREPVKRESKVIAEVVTRMAQLDDAGRKALTEALRVKAGKASDIDRARAKELLKHTKAEADRFQRDYPLFAYVARVGKDVFWHPKNPSRQVLKDLGEKGSYHLEVHLFRIEEREAHRPPRVWPLRVVRIKSDSGYDSGWKILPASDWDPEY